MIKSSLFLATALAAALGAGSALAQTNTNTATPNATHSSTAPATTATTSTTTSGAQFWTADNANEWRTSKIKGLSVYNNNNEKLGNIDDILVSHDGQIKAVVIGVGGFLGIGEHNVAVAFNQLQFVETPTRNVATATGPAGNNNLNNPPRNAAGNPTTTAPAGTTGLGSAPPANTANTATATGTGVPANSVAAANERNGAPDHAVLNATKDQLKNAPQFKYNG